MEWIEKIRARISANLDKNPSLSADQKAAVLESEVAKAVAASDAGQPLNETNPPRAGADESEPEGEVPAPVARSRRAASAW